MHKLSVKQHKLSVSTSSNKNATQALCEQFKQQKLSVSKKSRASSATLIMCNILTKLQFLHVLQYQHIIQSTSIHCRIEVGDGCTEAGDGCIEVGDGSICIGSIEVGHGCTEANDLLDLTGATTFRADFPGLPGQLCLAHINGSSAHLWQ